MIVQIYFQQNMDKACLDPWNLKNHAIPEDNHLSQTSIFWVPAVNLSKVYLSHPFSKITWEVFGAHRWWLSRMAVPILEAIA